jgi:hypothetical protein
MKDSLYIKRQIEAKGVRFWGDVPFDTELEENIGNVEGLLKTEFGRTLKLIIDRNLQST